MAVRHHVVVLGFVFDFGVIVTMLNFAWFGDMTTWHAFVVVGMLLFTLWSKPWRFWTRASVHRRLDNLKELGL